MYKKFQYFSNFKSKFPETELKMEQIVEMMQHDASLKSKTDSYRSLLNAGDAEAAKVIKKQLPQVSVGFRMEGGRKEENCKECLSYVLVDFDVKGLESKPSAEELEKIHTSFRTNYNTFVGNVSISGGYHVIAKFILPDGVEIDPQKDKARAKELYKRACEEVYHQFEQWTGCPVDHACSNVNRLMALSHDPLAVYRPDARCFYLTRAELGINDDGSLKSMRAKRSITSKDGERISTPASNVLGKAEDILREANVEFCPGNHHNYLMRLSFLLNRYGADEDEAAETLDDKYGAEYTEQKPSDILHSCYRSATDEYGCWMEKRNKKDGKTKTETIENFLKDKPLRYDVISRKIQQLADDRWIEMKDRDINDLLCECNKQAGIDITSSMFKNVLNSNVVTAVNPLHEYLGALVPWDESQPDYIRMVSETVHVGQPDEEEGLSLSSIQEIWHLCFKKWFIAMVASWLHEEIVNHEVLVLLGAQGIFKTTWLDRLLPPELRKYGSKQSATDRIDKDEQLRAVEYGLVNFDEIDKLGERDLNAIKSLVTCDSVDLRPAYGMTKEKRSRLASYVASGNKKEFLSDLTGNRRWLPFYVLSIENPFEHTLPYEGLYAEAVYLINNGYNYWFSQEDTHEISGYVDLFMVKTREEELLSVYFSPAKADDSNAKFYTVSEIQAKLKINGSLSKIIDIRQMGAILKKLGYQQVRRGKSRTRGYLVIEKASDLINAERSNILTDMDDSNTPF